VISPDQAGRPQGGKPEGEEQHDGSVNPEAHVATPFLPAASISSEIFALNAKIPFNPQ
jgi:hypothetical protein